MENLDYVDYSRQAEMDQDMAEEGLEKTGSHIVVGCGGVGFWLAFMLGMNGASRLILCDGQKIEPSNLNRIPVPQTWIGVNKTIALRRMIKMVRPECIVSCVPFHVLDDAGFNGLMKVSKFNSTSTTTFMIDSKQPTLLWDCTDDARVQRKLASFCEKFNRTHGFISYRKLGYEGYKVGFYKNMEAVWYDEETYQPGYRTSKANAMSSALTAAFGIFAQGLSTPKDITLDIKQIINTGGESCTSTNKGNTTQPRGVSAPPQQVTRGVRDLVEEMLGQQAQRPNAPTIAATLRRT